MENIMQFQKKCVIVSAMQEQYDLRKCVKNDTLCVKKY